MTPSLNEILVTYTTANAGRCFVLFTYNGFDATLLNTGNTAGTAWSFRTWHGSPLDPTRSFPVETCVQSLEELFVVKYPAPEFRTLLVPVKHNTCHAMRVGNRVYTEAHAKSRCSHCNEPFYAHAEGKCCFDVTTFAVKSGYGGHTYLETQVRSMLMRRE